jgi:hypothetical protein
MRPPTLFCLKLNGQNSGLAPNKVSWPANKAAGRTGLLSIEDIGMGILMIFYIWNP